MINLDFDSYVLYDGVKEIIVYPLLEFKRDNKDYLIYAYSNDVSNISDLYVGEINADDELIPINNELIKDFEDIVLKVFDEFNNNNNNIQ